MPPLAMPQFDFTKYKVRLQRTDLQAEGYCKTAAMHCCSSLRRQPELTPGPALLAQGPVDDARYGFVGRGADAMRSGSAAAAAEAPFLMMRDLADLPLNLPPMIQVGPLRRRFGRIFPISSINACPSTTLALAAPT